MVTGRNMRGGGGGGGGGRKLGSCKRGLAYASKLTYVYI